MRGDETNASGRRQRAVRRTAWDGWIDGWIVRHPEQFDGELGALLRQARDGVLRDGDAHSRTVLRECMTAGRATLEDSRIRRMLASRPDASERAEPALVQRLADGYVIALPRPVPQWGARLAVRLQHGRHADQLHAGAERIDPSPEFIARWMELGHTRHLVQVWRCAVPTRAVRFRVVALELAPSPSCFNDAVLIAHRGSGRVLVAQPPPDAGDDAWMTAAVMPSGWSYVRADHAQDGSRRYFPSATPHLAGCVRVTDARLFAACAARTWTCSLRDAIWLAERARTSSFTPTEPPIHPTHERDKDIP